jgi:hypothetical protein
MDNLQSRHQGWWRSINKNFGHLFTVIGKLLRCQALYLVVFETQLTAGSAWHL